MPLKSVIGSSPWKPISVHCLVMRDRSTVLGRKPSHNWNKREKSHTAINNKNPAALNIFVQCQIARQHLNAVETLTSNNAKINILIVTDYDGL